MIVSVFQMNKAEYVSENEVSEGHVKAMKTPSNAEKKSLTRKEYCLIICTWQVAHNEIRKTSKASKLPTHITVETRKASKEQKEQTVFPSDREE